MCFMLVLGEISSAQHKFCDRYATTRFAGANTCANSLCQLVVRLRLSSATTKLLVRAGSCHSDCCNEPLTASVWSSRRATATLLTASEISFCCSPKSTSGVRTDDQSAATVPSVARALVRASSLLLSNCMAVTRSPPVMTASSMATFASKNLADPSNSDLQ